MPVQMRTLKGCNCPICRGKRILKGFNDLQTLYPDIADEWDYEKNGELTPDSIFPKTNKKYWWKCKQGHSFEATPNYRTSRNKVCPYCSGRKK
jgi:DNA-directed RNA polymerase subunit RPC12/RpoP